MNSAWPGILLTLCGLGMSALSVSSLARINSASFASSVSFPGPGQFEHWDFIYIHTTAYYNYISYIYNFSDILKNYFCHHQNKTIITLYIYFFQYPPLTPALRQLWTYSTGKMNVDGHNASTGAENNQDGTRFWTQWLHIHPNLEVMFRWYAYNKNTPIDPSETRSW